MSHGGNPISSLSRAVLVAVAVFGGAVSAHAQAQQPTIAENTWYLTPRVWVGDPGGFGVAVEKTLAGDASASARLSIGANVDRFQTKSSGTSISLSAVGAFANYHIVLEGSRIAPYLGGGIQHASASAGGFSVSGTFVTYYAGARYFIGPRSAIGIQMAHGASVLALLGSFGL